MIPGNKYCALATGLASSAAVSGERAMRLHGLVAAALMPDLAVIDVMARGSDRHDFAEIFALLLYPYIVEKEQSRSEHSSLRRISCN